MDDFIAQGTFGRVFRRGNRAIKKFHEAPPEHFERRVLPALSQFIMAAECSIDGDGALHMPLWGPTLWDMYGSSAPDAAVLGELPCLLEQLNVLVSVGLVHADVKPSNVAFTGPKPAGAPPVNAGQRLDAARCAGMHGAGFVLIDLDSVCPLDSVPMSDLGSLCPYGGILEPLVKTPYLACYAMWFAASAALEEFHRHRRSAAAPSLCRSTSSSSTGSSCRRWAKFWPSWTGWGTLLPLSLR